MNIVEYYRQQVVANLFVSSKKVSCFGECFPQWKPTIMSHLPNMSPEEVFGLGDHLSDIFVITGKVNRSQGSLSGGGAAWEALTCWYLNLCLIGTNTLVIKHNRNFMPKVVSDAITVRYDTNKSNTESDLIAVTFPNHYDFTSEIPNNPTANATILKKLFDARCQEHFRELGIHIIQCKTNWNDNAQIPMLWDAVYSADSFRNGVTVGVEGYSIKDVKKFTYSFVTVPSQKNLDETFTITSTCVLRVRNLSGGNFWGHSSKSGVALSLKEMFHRNFTTQKSVIESLKDELPKLTEVYSYFGL